MSERIIQIIPVGIQTWAIVEDENESGKEKFHPVHAWALMEDEDGVQRVVGLLDGLTPDLKPCPEDYFSHYYQRGEDD